MCVAAALFAVAPAAADDATSRCDPALADIPDRDRAPEKRVPARYPTRCMEDARLTESVTLRFDVVPDGHTTRIEVLHSSNSCFNKEAVRAVERWKYACVPDGLAGVETVMTFKLEGDSDAPIMRRDANCVIFDRAAHDLDSVAANHALGAPCRAVVSYPLRCAPVSSESEYVGLSFDVSPEGEVKDVDVFETSNKCFNSIAKKSIKRRKFSPAKNGFQNVGALFTFAKTEKTRLPDCVPSNDKNAQTSGAPAVSCFATPEYPKSCIGKSNGAETVSFTYDVTPAGSISNIRLKGASHDCFIDAARNALSRSIYERSATGAKDQETTMTFELGQ